jgi:hypothetical protein
MQRNPASYDAMRRVSVSDSNLFDSLLLIKIPGGYPKFLPIHKKKGSLLRMQGTGALHFFIIHKEKYRSGRSLHHIAGACITGSSKFHFSGRDMKSRVPSFPESELPVCVLLADNERSWIRTIPRSGHSHDEKRAMKGSATPSLRHDGSASGSRPLIRAG